MCNGGGGNDRTDFTTVASDGNVSADMLADCGGARTNTCGPFVAGAGALASSSSVKSITDL